MDYMSDFSESLKELMLEKNLTYRALSKIIGISISNIGRWINREQFIYLSSALKLADCFECSLEFLFGRVDTRLNYIPRSCPPFYNRLKEIMQLQAITQYKLFIKDKIVTPSQFHQWKNGSDISYETLITLAKYFNCTLDYLVGREG